MQVESVEISSLVSDPSNARKHSEKNLEAIKGSLQKFGQQKNIVVRNNVVIAGNGTLEAAKALGWTHVTVKRADDMSATEATAYALADNRTAELAEWDFDVLGSTLHSLREEDFDLTGIGFDVSYLDNILGADDPPLPGGDDTPEKFMITVIFENDAAQQDLFTELRDRGFKVKA